MYADRYAPKPVNRGSLTLSVGVVGGLVAAAMLSPTVVRHVTRDDPLPIFTVAPPPPPPPVEQPPVEEKVAPKPTQIAPPDPIVPPIAAETFPLAPPLDPGPPPDPGALSGTGTGGGVVVDPPKPPTPVIVGAQPDPRVDFQPTYPAEERRAGNTGTVILKVLIGVDGRVRQVEKVAAASDAFWRVTEQRALRAWRFKPATRDGVPYEVWRQMTVRFKLEAE